MWKALLVEDEPFARRAFKVQTDWQAHGFELAGEAGNGREALRRIAELKPHLVITDIKMPVMSGLDLVRVSKERGDDCLFVMLTCMNEFEYARQALEYGASGYLLKASADESSLAATLGKIRRELEVAERKRNESDELWFGKRHSIDANRTSMRLADLKPVRTDNDIVNHTVMYIHQNLDKPLTVRELAGIAGLSEDYFSSLFRKKTGETVVSYILRTKIELACKLLMEIELPISQIAEMTGFASENYFFRIFKRTVGRTPGQYRVGGR